MNKNPLRILLDNAGVETLNEMQKAAIKTISEHENSILLSPTGSGKTLAYLLPLIPLLTSSNNEVQAIVISPSRELALQIEKVFKLLQTGFKSATFYGGHAMQDEINTLSSPPALVVGTPGRISDHFRNLRINTKAIQYLVLDEFDKCLELGFEEDLHFIIGKLPNLKKRVLVSATPPENPDALSGFYRPAMINYLTNETNSRLQLFHVEVSEASKAKTLMSLIAEIETAPTIIFCNTREQAARLSNELHKAKIANSLYHGALDQRERERSLIRFRNGSSWFLVTTDLAARGLDISAVKHIIHFDVPANTETFTHRNGRTARMFAEGSAFLMCGEKLPHWLEENIDKYVLGELKENYQHPKWETFYLNAGKKEKIRKLDVVGWVLQNTKLSKEELGTIDVLDHATYFAVSKNQTGAVLQKLRDLPLKKMKIRLEVAGN